MTQRVIYIADDGEEFETEEECTAYERCKAGLPGILGFDDDGVYQDPKETDTDSAFYDSQYVFITNAAQAVETLKFIRDHYGYEVPTMFQTGDLMHYNGEEDEQELILYEEDMQDDAYAEDEETAYEEDSGQEPVSGQDTGHTEQEQEPLIDEDGSYTTKEDVALYIHTYGKLPHNFITKKEAQKLGWSGGSLEPYAPGKCIGGNHFGNYEGALPDGNYRECDIDTLGKKSRGAKRIIYSDDGRIYYTGDHYKTFEQLY